jgi:predicted nuclease of restriction endonuclease-like (RecB) superfamily
VRATRAVNSVLIENYWQIGREIGARQREQGWGTRVSQRLSADLRSARPDMRGLSLRNLQYMAALANRWPTEIAQCSVAKLPWGLVATLLDGARTGRPQSFTPTVPLLKAGPAPSYRQ